MQIKTLSLALVAFCTISGLHGAQQMVIERFSKEEKQKSADVHMQIEQESKEKLSEEAELAQAFGSCEIARFPKSEITITAMDAAGKVLVLAERQGSIHCCSNNQWEEFALFDEAPSLLAVSGGYIAASLGKLVEIIEIEHCQRPQEFELEAPLLALVSHRGDGSFVALDANRELLFFEYHRQSGTHQRPTKVNKKIDIKGADKGMLSALGTALVAIGEKRICLETFGGKNPVARVIESPKPFNVTSISPDGSVLVTGAGTELTAWKSSGAPCSFTLERVPQHVIIDSGNRFVVCASEQESGWVCYDLQTKHVIRLPSMSGACITQALFLPSCMQAFLTVGQSARHEAVITAHLLTVGSFLSQAQQQLLIKIARAVHDDTCGYTLQQQERALLTSLNPLIQRVLTSRYKVKL